MSDSLKKMSNSLIFGERPERFTHITQREWANHSGFLNLQKNLQKHTEKYIFVNFFLSELLIFCEGKRNEQFSQKKSELLIRSFIMSNLSESLPAAHERPERFAHHHSFVPSDLSELLTVAHLSWAIWANEQMGDERIPNPEILYKIGAN